MLTALIQERHDDSDLSRLVCHGRDDSLQISIVIVRRHSLSLATHGVCAAIVSYIKHDIYVFTAD